MLRKSLFENHISLDKYHFSLLYNGFSQSYFKTWPLNRPAEAGISKLIDKNELHRAGKRRVKSCAHIRSTIWPLNQPAEARISKLIEKKELHWAGKRRVKSCAHIRSKIWPLNRPVEARIRN